MKLILGSKSPRRKELLQDCGYQFEIRTKDTDESFPADYPVKEVAMYVASKKSDDLLSDASDDEVILCADTTVVVDNLILNKPGDRAEAIRMLELLSGRIHEVITGVSIVSKERSVTFAVTTKVEFRPLSADEITYYVDTYKPFDKAGAYGIQEWIGYTSVSRIEGSYNNVVGLPTQEVYEALKRFNE